MGRVDLKTRLLLGLAAAGAFLVLLGIEFLKEEALTILDIVQEAATAGLLVGGSVISALFALRLREQEEQTAGIGREIARLRAEDEAWRVETASHFREIGGAIQRQFLLWGLSPSEQEVGLLLLKGFSHKEIARLRRTGEATIRQQATAVYLKSGLQGRAGLSAYFLEELLLPPKPVALVR